MRYSIVFPENFAKNLLMRLDPLDEVNVLQRLILLEKFGPDYILASPTNNEGQFEVSVDTSFGTLIFTLTFKNETDLIIKEWRKHNE